MCFAFSTLACFAPWREPSLFPPFPPVKCLGFLRCLLQNSSNPAKLGCRRCLSIRQPPIFTCNRANSSYNGALFVRSFAFSTSGSPLFGSDGAIFTRDRCHAQSPQRNFHFGQCVFRFRRSFVRFRRSFVQFRQCLVRLRQCSVRLRQCSVRLRQCSVRLRQHSVRLRQRAVQWRQCCFHLRQRSVRLRLCCFHFGQCFAHPGHLQFRPAQGQVDLARCCSQLPGCCPHLPPTDLARRRCGLGLPLCELGRPDMVFAPLGRPSAQLMSSVCNNEFVLDERPYLIKRNCRTLPTNPEN